MNQRRRKDVPVTPGNANAYVGDGTMASGSLRTLRPGRFVPPVEPFKRPALWGMSSVKGSSLLGVGGRKRDPKGAGSSTDGRK